MTNEGIAISAMVVATALGREWLHAIKSRQIKKMAEKRDEDIAHIKKVGDDTHTLSNSAMCIALKDNSVSKYTIYVMSKRIADITHSAEDQAAVELAQMSWVAAEKSLSKHEAQQANVDSRPG